MLWKKVNGNSIISSAVRSFSFSISSHVFNILAHYDGHKIMGNIYGLWKSHLAFRWFTYSSMCMSSSTRRFWWLIFDDNNNWRRDALEQITANACVVFYAQSIYLSGTFKRISYPVVKRILEIAICFQYHIKDLYGCILFLFRNFDSVPVLYILKLNIW